MSRQVSPCGMIYKDENDHNRGLWPASHGRAQRRPAAGVVLQGQAAAVGFGDLATQGRTDAVEVEHRDVDLTEDFAKQDRRLQGPEPPYLSTNIKPLAHTGTSRLLYPHSAWSTSPTSGP